LDIRWQNTIQINRPVEQVYTYLADFPRHCEWAQTLVRLEQIRPGDNHGIGAQYLTIERQAMQTNRKPGEELTQGMMAKTMCEIRELIPNRRIAWHAHFVPNVGTYADLSFELIPTANGGTELTQTSCFYQPAPIYFVFRLIFGSGLQQKARAQWDASLRNIKAILEQSDARPNHHGPGSA
jgi:uncharacterized membrane protein